jgi:DNA-binding NarL/FixJ family response regulator
LTGTAPASRAPAGTAPTRVVLADDQDLVRAGLRLMIDRAPGLTVVAEAATGGDAVRIAREARADVVLMDIRMPGLDGLAATRRIAADDSLAGARVLILTTFEVDEYVFEALRSGASGFLGKGARPEVLIDAIRTVARGDALLSPSATRGLIARFLRLHDSEPVHASPLLATLTDREREVVALIADGMSNAEIARQLTLSPLTVKTHANHAMTKLGARDRAQLVVLAYQTGLARPPRPSRELPPPRGRPRAPRRGIAAGESPLPHYQQHYPERSRGGSQSPGLDRFRTRRTSLELHPPRRDTDLWPRYNGSPADYENNHHKNVR